MMPHSDLPYIGLLRVSGDKQDVLRQRSDLEKLKKKFGISISRTVELWGVSGTATLDDEQVIQIRADLKRADNAGVALSSLDRLLRAGKRFGQAELLDDFIDNNKVIYSWSEGLIDPNTDEGFGKCWQALGQGAIEWRKIRQRSYDQRRCLAEIGIIPHGNPRFGYDIIGRKQTGRLREGRMVINEKEAPIVIEIFERRRRGQATYAIAAWLNEMGVRNKCGEGGAPPKPWSRDTVRQLLKDTIYIGKHVFQGITIPVPPIVDEELFYAVQASMEESAKRWIGRPSSIYLLRTFLWCGLCGHRCIGTRNGKDWRAYRCGYRTNKPPHKRLCDGKNIEARLLENAVWAEIWGMLKNPKLLLEMGRDLFAAQAAPASETEKLEKRIARLQQSDKNLTRMMKSAKDDEEYDQLLRERQEGRTQLATLESSLRIAAKVVNFPPLDVLEEHLRTITENEAETYDERRNILEGLLDLRMEYLDGVVTITGQVPVSVPQAATGNGVRKCEGRVGRPPISALSIPFNLKRRVA